jgi:hypothetical protein
MSTERFEIVFTAAPGFRGPAIARLRRLLKISLRTFGLRCIEARQVNGDGVVQTDATRQKGS